MKLGFGLLGIVLGFNLETRWPIIKEGPKGPLPK